MSKTFAVVYERGLKWIQGQRLSEQPLKPPVAYLLRLHESGQVVMGGPYADETGGLVVLTANDLAEARRLIEKDPAVVAGILQAEVHAWDRVV